MKKIIIAAAVLVAGFSTVKFTIDQRTAEVNQFQGFYIYTDCKPVSEFTYIATVKATKLQLGQATGTDAGLTYCDLTYSQLKDNLIEQAKKKHKGKGNGMIINTENNTADLIDLK